MGYHAIRSRYVSGNDDVDDSGILFSGGSRDKAKKIIEKEISKYDLGGYNDENDFWWSRNNDEDHGYRYYIKSD